MNMYSFTFADQRIPINPTLFRGPQCFPLRIKRGYFSGSELDLQKCNEDGIIDYHIKEEGDKNKERDYEKINISKKKPLVQKYAHIRSSNFGSPPLINELNQKYVMVEENSKEALEGKMGFKYDYKGKFTERPTSTFYPYPFPIIIENMKNKIKENEKTIQDPNIPLSEKIKLLYDFSKYQNNVFILNNREFLPHGITKENGMNHPISNGLVFAGYDKTGSKERLTEFGNNLRYLLEQCGNINQYNDKIIRKIIEENELLNLDEEQFYERVWFIPEGGFFGEDTGEQKEISNWEKDCFFFYKPDKRFLGGKHKTRKHKRKTHKKQKKNRKTTRHLKKRSRRNH